MSGGKIKGRLSWRDWELHDPRADRTHAKIGAHMRKNISFTVAATIFGLGMMLWVATRADVLRPPVGTSAYVVISNSYLPIQVLDETY
jgi:hypothetical protein